MKLNIIAHFPDFGPFDDFDDIADAAAVSTEE
jgi:hypothetical protein